MRSVLFRLGRLARAVILGLFASCCILALLPTGAFAQDTTLYVDDFESLPVGTLSHGCGDMSISQWRWQSHHYHACYSAGWGIDYAAPLSGSSTGTDKALELWGGVPFGGGGDCAVTASASQFQSLADYSIAVAVSPERLINGMEICKSGMVGIAGRVQDGGAFCSGYLLALVLNNGESLCGQGSLLQLYRNERGPYCNGSEAMSLLASEPVDITADLGGNFSPEQQYVLKLCMSGSDIYGGVWSAAEWNGGDGSPIAEVNATDGTYTTGTFGIYQGATRSAFDDVIVSIGGSCLIQQSTAMEADLDFDPNTLNTKSKGNYVTCYVELPEGYDPWDIDVATVTLNDVIPAEPQPTTVGDHDEDGIDDRMMKFKRFDLIGLLSGTYNSLYAQIEGLDSECGGNSGGAEWSLGGTSGGGETGLEDAVWGSGTSGGAEYSTAGFNDADTVEVWVSGLLEDGTEFAGLDTIRVLGLDGGSQGAAGDDSGSSDESAPVLTATPSVVRGKSKIGFELKVEGHVRLYVYDAAGRMVRTLVDEYSGPGAHYVTWDRETDDGRLVPPGVYFVKLGQFGRSSVQKLMVVK